MQGPTFLGKGWRFPVDLDRTGSVSMSANEDNVRDCIFVILGTPPGERLMHSQFGCEIHDLVFWPNNETTRSLAAHYCKEALQKWEPRVTNVGVKARPSPGEPHKILIDIEYTVAKTNTKRNLVYPFYLEKHEEKR
jgi:uncharacterized protein